MKTGAGKENYEPSYTYEHILRWEDDSYKYQNPPYNWYTF